MNIYEAINNNFKSVEDLGELTVRDVKNLDWPDGNVACFNTNDLSTKDILNIVELLDKAEYLFKVNNFICLYSKEVNSLGGRHFSDFKDSIESYK